MLRDRDPARDDDALVRTYRLAFGSDEPGIRRWLDLEGKRVRLTDDAAAVLIDIPMAQWWSGRAVTMHGVAGVAVAPEARGRGLAQAMMRTHLHQLHEAGVALSALYASTRSLYRRVGYEIAGERFRHAMATEHLRGQPDLPLRPVDDAAKARIAAARATWGPALPEGTLRRGAYVWRRVWIARDDVAHDAWWVDDGGTLAGWVVVRLVPGDPFPTLHVQDVAASTPAAWSAIRAHLRGFASMGRTIVWHGAATTPLASGTAEHRVDTRLFEPWMLRLVHLPSAIAERGWPRGLVARVDLEVDDPDLPQQAGRWRLQVADGDAQLTRGGEGAVRVHVGALARLYAGHLGAAALAAEGGLAGPTDDVQTLGACFRGPRASLADMF